MSLHTEYLLEREETETVEVPDRGFATFKFPDAETCYIVDIYVRPEFRRGSLARQMADEILSIARTRGAKWVMGTVDPKYRHADASMRVLLAYGMAFRGVAPDSGALVFSKEIPA